MPTAFHSLLGAILADDCAGIEALLASDPSVIAWSAGEDRFEPAISHYIYCGDTLLHAAAAGYRLEIAEKLLAAGADVSAAQNRRAGQSLHYAADGHPGSLSWNPPRQTFMILMLLKAGAEINARDKNGATPLHRAVRSRCAAAVKCLLAAGSDPTLRNNSGSTPFHLAVQSTGRGGSGAEAVRAEQELIIRSFMECGVSTALPGANGKSVLQSTRSDWIRRILSPAHAPLA